MTDVAKKRRLTSSTKGYEMNDGVALLLERMKTHPEEFVADGGVFSKWESLINQYKDALDHEDKQLLTQGLNKVYQQRFTEKVMEELIEPRQPTIYKTVNLTQNNTVWNGGAASGAITLNTPIAGVTQTAWTY